MRQKRAKAAQTLSIPMTNEDITEKLDNKPHPASPEARFADLQRQGFMKPYKAPRIKAKRVIVACEQCSDWHPKGKHSKPKSERKPGKQRAIDACK
jgi:hypothetical protein